MALILVLGGARSGKSRLAERLVGGGDGQVTVVATAEPGDEEMRLRILEHQRARPEHWEVVEAPIELGEALGRVGANSRVIIDCLTLWVSNLLGAGFEDDQIRDRARHAADLAKGRDLATVVVSNEVGSGIVPINPLARRYRDLLGRVNTVWADAASRVYLTVAGGLVPVQPFESVWSEASDD